MTLVFIIAPFGIAYLCWKIIPLFTSGALDPNPTDEELDEIIDKRANQQHK